MKNIVDRAKAVQKKGGHGLRKNLTDNEAMDLIFAYVEGSVSGVQVSTVLIELGFKIRSGNGATILGSRLLGLVRRGKIKITRAK